MKAEKCDDTQLEFVKQEFSRSKAYSEEYQEETPIGHFFKARIDRVSEFLSNFKEGKVLDVGCGPAMIGQIFKGRPIQYCGVDVSEDMIRVGVETFGSNSKYNFFIGKIEELGFKRDCFDVVLCLGVLEYVLDGHTAVNEVVRVLKPGGILIATMLNERSPYRLWQTYGYWKVLNGVGRLRRIVRRKLNEQKTQSGSKAKRPHCVGYGQKAFKQLLASSGLKVEDVVYYDFNVIPAPVDAKIPRVSVSLSQRLEFLGRGRLKYLGTGFLAKCRKD